MPDVRMPDGTIIKNVPEGTTQDELLARYEGRSTPNVGEPPESIEEPSFIGNINNLLHKATGNGRILAGPLSLPSQLEAGVDLVGKGLGGIAGGIAAAPVAFEPEAKDIVENVSSAVSSPFAARTEAGQSMANRLTAPFELLERGADRIGEAAPGGPGVQTGVKTALLSVPGLFSPAKSVGRQGTLVQRGALTPRQEILSKAQAEGYVVPTSSANPNSVSLGAVEGMAGKPRMQQQASFKNQEVTNRLVSEELGLPDGVQISLDSLDAVRREAGQAYNVLENAGTIVPNVAFRRDISKAISDLNQVSKDFPALAKKDSPVRAVMDLANGLNKPTFKASSVVSATRLLRDEASTAFRNGQGKVGQAYRDLSKALEDAAEAHLTKFGDPEAVQAFRDARQRIAKSYSVEKALDGDGFVNANKLASQRSKREPLTGNLQLIAEFADQFPKSTRVIKEPPIQTGRMSTLLGGLGMTGGLIAGAPSAAIPSLALAFGGPAVRAGLLSRAGRSTFGRPRPAITNLPETNLGLLGSGILSDPPE